MLKELEQLRSADRSLRVEALDTLVELAMSGRDDATQKRGVVTGYREFDQEIYSRALNRLWVFDDGSLAEALLKALAPGFRSSW